MIGIRHRKDGTFYVQVLRTALDEEKPLFKILEACGMIRVRRDEMNESDGVADREGADVSCSGRPRA